MLPTLFSLILAQANEDCTLDFVLFEDVSIAQAQVLKKYGASCQDAVNLETKAQDIYGKATDAVAAGNTKLAKQYLTDLENNYRSTQTWTAASRLKNEVEVVGLQVNKYTNVDWIQGYDDIRSGTVLLVFWEVWCPHCKRELPKLQQLHEQYQHKGLKVVGLTKMNRSSTPEKISEFIRKNNIQYPIGKEDGQMTAMFAVTGVPAAAIIHNGRVVWRGHPANIDSNILGSYLQ